MGRREGETAAAHGGVEAEKSAQAVTLGKGHRRTRITASHVYGFLSCEHAVWLEFFGDRDAKLEPTPELDQLLRRGRELEARFVADLSWDEPQYERGEWDRAAAETLRLMRAGVVGITQGVFLDEPWLGIPDLLRREVGASDFGDFHYVVGDIKSSRRPRADQAMQVAFYSRLLTALQGRRPDYGYLVLKDGREERIDLDALEPVLDEVLEELTSLLARGPDLSSSRPHQTFKCRGCAWRAHCARVQDVHWVPGLTRSVRSILERQGFRSLEALSLVEPRKQARGGVLPEASWQRAKQGAEALRARRPVRVRKPRLRELREPATSVVALFDAFEERVPILAWRAPDGESIVLRARTRQDEELAWRRILAELGPSSGSLVHGGGLPARLYESLERFPELAEDVAQLEERALDIMSIVRGTWIFPSPVRRPVEAVSWLRGAEPVEDANSEESVALQLELGEWDALEAIARAELAALRDLVAELRGQS